MPPQRGPELPVNLGKPSGELIPVFGQVQRGVAAGGEKERDKNDTSGSPFHAGRSGARVAGRY